MIVAGERPPGGDFRRQERELGSKGWIVVGIQHPQAYVVIHHGADSIRRLVRIIQASSRKKYLSHSRHLGSCDTPLPGVRRSKFASTGLKMLNSRLISPPNRLYTQPNPASSPPATASQQPARSHARHHRSPRRSPRTRSCRGHSWACSPCLVRPHSYLHSLPAPPRWCSLARWRWPSSRNTRTFLVVQLGRVRFVGHSSNRNWPNA